MASLVAALRGAVGDCVRRCSGPPPDPALMPPAEAFAYRRREAGRRDAAARPSAEAGEFRLVRVAAPDGQGYAFPSNFVRTSKYTVLTFLPLFLRNAFDPYLHSANTFFLVVCAMQCVPYITYTAIITLFGVEMGTPTTLLPLGFVVAVDAIFQALEDATRHNADYEANNSPTRLVDPTSGAVVDAPWRDVRVGDLVVVRNREVAPADLVVLGVARTAGDGEYTDVCYVETKSLDGETNLKQRRAVKEARGRVAPRDAAGGAFDCGGLAGAVVEMEHPNDVIAKFEGTIAFAAAGGSPPEKAAVNLDFVYMRGTTVRSVDWVLGVAVNTGPDTKIMKSNKDPPMKESSLILAINRVLKYIIGLLTMICLTGGLCSYLWMSSDALCGNQPLVWGVPTKLQNSLAPSNRSRFG